MESQLTWIVQSKLASFELLLFASFEVDSHPGCNLMLLLIMIFLQLALKKTMNSENAIKHFFCTQLSYMDLLNSACLFSAEMIK